MLVLAEDGQLKLRIHDTTEILWSSCKHGSPGGSPPFLLKIGDGSLMVEDSAKRKIWSTDTDFKGSIGCSLHLNKDGSAVLRDSRNEAIWSTGTSGSKVALPHIWGVGDVLDLAHYNKTMMNQDAEDRSKMQQRLTAWAYSVELVRESAIEMMNLKDGDMMEPDILLEKMSKMTIGYNFQKEKEDRIRLQDCVVSFPGASQTWTGLIGSTKVALACVFLPQPRAFMRIFKANHSADPDQPESKCWCHRLYGQQKEHGCVWFELWKTNVEVALKNEQTLLVVYIDMALPGSSVQRFPLEVFHRLDQDRHLDGDLPTWADPQAECKMFQWLGTSQRAEVAWLLQKGQDAKARGSDFKLKFIGLSEFKKSYGFVPETSVEESDSALDLLQMLENQPAHENDVISELTQDVSEEEKKHVKTAKFFVIIGETGAGKSSFCGLCDGSLAKENGKWVSSFKLGHGADAETNEAKLRFFHWLGQSDGSPLVMMDTPGLEDTRGPAQDELQMQQVARKINSLPVLHGVILLLKHNTRISNNMRKTFEFFQRLLGREMWSHCTVVVNFWLHDARSKRNREKDATAAFEQNVRETLTKRLPIEAKPGEHQGLGLSEDEAEQPKFFFVDTNYDRDCEDETRSMREELGQLKMRLQTLEEWKVKAEVKSSLLKRIIEAVKGQKLEELEQVLGEAKGMPDTDRPLDVTDEKLKAVEDELQRRSGSELFAEATASLERFEEGGDKKSADDFLQALHALKTQKFSSVSSELRNKLSHLEMMGTDLQNAFEGVQDSSGSGSRRFQERLQKLHSEAQRKQHLENVILKFFEKYGLGGVSLEEIVEWALANRVSTAEELAHYAHLWVKKIHPDSDIARSKVEILIQLENAKSIENPSAEQVDFFLELRKNAMHGRMTEGFLKELELEHVRQLRKLLTSTGASSEELHIMEEIHEEIKCLNVHEVKEKLKLKKVGPQW